MAATTAIVVVGIGNDFRNDDGVGLYVARLIEAMDFKDVTVIPGVAEGTALLDSWENAARAYVIDCAVSGQQSGTIHRFEIAETPIPAEIFNGYSTHNISVADAVELARVLGRLPKSLVVYGIEGGDFRPGGDLSPEVTAAAHKVVDEIIAEIAK
jgi:hydrogenase maturation protease